LLLGIRTGDADLGGQRRVTFPHFDFHDKQSRARRKGSILNPFGICGFRNPKAPPDPVSWTKHSDKIARAGVEAARRKFNAGIQNRIDKVVVFKPLGQQDTEILASVEHPAAAHHQLLDRHAVRLSLTEPPKTGATEGTDMVWRGT